MKIIFRAAMMALIGTIGSAYANDSKGQSGQAITRLTEIPGVVAQAPMQPVTTAQSDQAIRTYAPRSNRTTWLFPPIGKYLAE